MKNELRIFYERDTKSYGFYDDRAYLCHCDTCILAAVALPKFAGIQGQAEVSIIKAFTGTLSRTVGPMMWSTSISNDGNGSIKIDSASDEFMGEKLPHYVDNFPKFLNENSVNFDACVVDGVANSKFITAAGTGTLNIFCRDGDESNAPRFEASEADTYTF